MTLRLKQITSQGLKIKCRDLFYKLMDKPATAYVALDTAALDSS